MVNSVMYIDRHWFAVLCCRVVIFAHERSGKRDALLLKFQLLTRVHSEDQLTRERRYLTKFPMLPPTSCGCEIRHLKTPEIGNLLPGNFSDSCGNLFPNFSMTYVLCTTLRCPLLFLLIMFDKPKTAAIVSICL